MGLIKAGMGALGGTLATLSANKVQYYEIPAHTLEISEALNEQLSKAKYALFPVWLLSTSCPATSKR